MNLKTACALFAAGILATGCASPGFSILPYPNVPEFPPGDPAKVEVLRADPVRPHTRLAEITVDASSSPPPSTREIEGLLRVAAARVGADAAIIVDDPTAPGGQVATTGWWGRTPASRATREVIAVAIKYR